MISSPRPNILIVEDDEAVRQTLADILEVNGYEVRQSADGREGLAAALTAPPTLIITDINMPGLTGFELLEQLRSHDELRTVPVIVITAKVDRAAMRLGMELGADDFITKPFTEDEVIQSVQARLEKRELLDELDAFAHTVAHDLKNPLATLNGRLCLLQMTLHSADAASMERNLEQAVTAASRLATIIDELLILAGVRRQAIEPTPLDMSAIVQESLERLESLVRETGAQITVPESWPTVLGHAPWVVHVWTNFISNAAKYAGPTPRIELGHDPVRAAEPVRFWVRDHGPGLEPALQARLFVPFTDIGSTRAKGHGLGLSIVRRIIEKLEGQVGLESSPGAGAKFWFELPQSGAAKAAH